MNVERIDGLEVRRCTKKNPMPHEQAKEFFWLHADAVEVRPFFNLVLYECPNCKWSFVAAPRARESKGGET